VCLVLQTFLSYVTFVSMRAAYPSGAPKKKTKKKT
jgi:hypothetical protein